MLELLQTGPDTTVWDGWGSVILVVTTSTMFMIVVGILVWQGFKTWQTNITKQAIIAREGAYQALAEDAVSVQRRMVEQTDKLAADLADMRTRVANIERLLQQVE